MKKLIFAALLFGSTAQAQEAPVERHDKEELKEPADPTQHFNWASWSYSGNDEYGGPMGDGKEVGPDGQEYEEEPMSAPFVLALANFAIFLFILAKYGGPDREEARRRSPRSDQDRARRGGQAPPAGRGQARRVREAHQGRRQRDQGAGRRHPRRRGRRQGAHPRRRRRPGQADQARRRAPHRRGDRVRARRAQDGSHHRGERRYREAAPRQLEAGRPGEARDHGHRRLVVISGAWRAATRRRSSSCHRSTRSPPTCARSRPR